MRIIQKSKFCTIKPFLIYCIIYTMITTINFTTLYPDKQYSFNYLDNKCIFLAIFPVIMFYLSFLTLSNMLLFLSVFAFTTGPMCIIMHQIFVYTFVILAFQLAAILIFIIFNLEETPLTIGYIRQGLEILKKRLFFMLCVKVLIYTIFCFFTYVILYFPDFLKLTGIQKYVMIILNILCLYYNYRIAIILFSCITSDIILTTIFNRQVTFRYQIWCTLSNLIDNLKVANCNVFHFQAFSSYNNFKNATYNKLHYFLGIGTNCSYIMFIQKDIYNIPIMALYKICKCDQVYFSRFDRHGYFIKYYKNPSSLLFNFKWLCIGMAGWYFQVFRVTDYYPDNLVLDKEFQSRLYVFYCIMLAISMCFELYDIAWKSLLVAYVHDPNAIQEYDIELHKFLLLNTPS